MSYKVKYLVPLLFLAIALQSRPAIAVFTETTTQILEFSCNADFYDKTITDCTVTVEFTGTRWCERLYDAPDYERGQCTATVAYYLEGKEAPQLNTTVLPVRLRMNDTVGQDVFTITVAAPAMPPQVHSAKVNRAVCTGIPQESEPDSPYTAEPPHPQLLGR